MDKKFGFVRVASAIPDIKVADVQYNVDQILELIEETAKKGADIVVFPEMCITGYTCGDLFHTRDLIEQAENGLNRIRNYIQDNLSNFTVIVGAPRFDGVSLYNSAFIIGKDNMSYVDKTFLPNYKEFYEKRWFKPSHTKNNHIFSFKNVFDKNVFSFGVELCEDVWSPNPPSTDLSLMGADIIFNLSASNDVLGKNDYLKNLLSQQSARCICGYVYSSCGFGESTQDLVFGGKGFIYENGRLLSESKRFVRGNHYIINDIDIQAIRHDRIKNITFQDSIITDNIDRIELSQSPIGIDNNTLPETLRTFNPHPFYSQNKEETNRRCEEIMKIQAFGLAKRLDVTKCKAVIGVSGGSDSTLALLVTYEAMKILGRSPKEIIGITMPGFATSRRTHRNSDKLMNVLGITSMTVDICETCEKELKSIGHPIDNQDVTFENVQARQRTAILMNIANQEKGLVIGTGDLSELALGWCTYNADHMSMYGVNCSIPKTLVKKEIEWYSAKMRSNGEDSIADVLDDILDTPVSPELTGSGADGATAQVTEDKIGPYELHDFFLYNFLRHGFSVEKLLWMATKTTFDKPYTNDELKKWLNVFMKRFVSNQFKRSCLPDGPKVGSITLSPRGDWRMPSDTSDAIFLLS